MKTDKNSRTHDQGLSAQNDERAVSDITTAKPIRNCRQLRQVIAQGITDFRLLLAGGALSSKLITLENDNLFRVENWIDDSIQILNGRQLYTESNIGRAMQQGAFVTVGVYHE